MPSPLAKHDFEAADTCHPFGVASRDLPRDLPVEVPAR